MSLGRQGSRKDPRCETKNPVHYTLQRKWYAHRSTGPHHSKRSISGVKQRLGRRYHDELEEVHPVRPEHVLHASGDETPRAVRGNYSGQRCYRGKAFYAERGNNASQGSDEAWRVLKGIGGPCRTESASEYDPRDASIS